MSGIDQELEDMLGPDPVAEPAENLVETEVAAKPPSRGLLERSRSYPIGVRYRAKKNQPEKLRRIISYAVEMPVTADICRRVGVSVTTLKYWLQQSLEGTSGDGFDMPMTDDDENGTPDNSVRFHEAFNLAIEAGVEAVEAATIKRATGYEEVLTYQGKVQYRYDPIKVQDSIDLGLPEYVPSNYLLDPYGAPVPETVWKMDPDLAMFILKTRKPQIYGAKAQIDVNVKGGVLVVPMRAAEAVDLNAIEGQYRQQGRPTVTFEEGDEDDV